MSGVRTQCVAQYQAAVGPTLANVTAAVTALLGSAFVAVHTTVGSDLETPPTITYWPGVNPGASSYSLGGGTWLSERAHLWVEVIRPSGMEFADFNKLMNVQLFELLDRMLPAWATFNWATSAGFVVDVSQLDFDGVI